MSHTLKRSFLQGSEYQVLIEDFEDGNDIESKVCGFSGGKRIENV